MVTHFKDQNSVNLKMYEDKKKELKEAKTANAKIAKDFLSLKDDAAKAVDAAAKKQKELQDRVNELTRDLDASRKDAIDAEARSFTRGTTTPLSRERNLEALRAFFQSPVFTEIGDRCRAADVQNGFQLAIDQLTHLGGIAEGFHLKKLDITKRGDMTDEPVCDDDDIVTAGDDFELVLGEEKLFMVNTGVGEVVRHTEEGEILGEENVLTVPNIPEGAFEVEAGLEQFSHDLISDLLSADEDVGAINVPIGEFSLDDEEEINVRAPAALAVVVLRRNQAGDVGDVR